MTPDMTATAAIMVTTATIMERSWISPGRPCEFGHGCLATNAKCMAGTNNKESSDLLELAK